MVRRAYRGAFSAEEIDDIYAGAWVGTLRALADRAGRLSDDEVRSYLLTAVANQAGKELRRRRRKPTAPLELVGGVADQGESPDELASGREQSRVTRDLLTSLPPRRRAVMLLRYGWGLEPSQVCALVDGLSPRAYRKEITRGVAELTERMRALERGEWCAEREPLLRALVSGLATAEQERQARAHLAHCRDCSDFVARLGGHLHDLGGAAAAAGAIDGIEGRLHYADRLLELGDRVRDAAGSLISRAPPAGAEQGLAQGAAAGGTRGAGAAGAGVVAKLAGLGATGKLAVACLGGGVAATACVAAGVAPFGLGGEAERGSRERPAAHRPIQVTAAPVPVVAVPEADGGDISGGMSEPEPAPVQPPQPAPEPEPVPEPEQPLAPTTPPVEREFGVAASVPAAPSPAPVAPATAPSSGGGGSAVQQEFGP
jgi:RNA polymerase sigma factor (sigma-70 family)